MNKTDRKYFDALYKDRCDNADLLEKRSMRGVKSSVVEKYSDQAHFIYELLQNADDTGAVYARFVLKKDHLIFAHNGKRDFSVSNPEKEDKDSKSGKLGDINAITSIGNSNKTEASIGKFGVGFKAVFQYTNTPHIYSPKFRFKIERFIVPTLINDDDLPERRRTETLFIFPFDRKDEYEKTAAFADISKKLKSLTFPTLFLNNLKIIKFEIHNSDKSCTEGSYEKTIKEEIPNKKTITQKIRLTKKIENNSDQQDLWLFTRNDNHGHSYSVGYFLKDNHLKPVKYSAFCFFPTKEVTHLNFIVNAPFLLNDSRESIRAGVSHNEKMIANLAKLAADSLIYLKDIGIKKSIRLIDDNILYIIPTDENSFNSEMDLYSISFKPFYDKIKDLFSNGKILPAADGYINKNNAYWADVPKLTQIFTDKQLSQIHNYGKDAKWVFVTLGSNEVDNIEKKYINDIVVRKLEEKDLINGIDERFIENQDIKWLHKFYEWLSASKDRTERIKKKPILLNKKKKAAAAFNCDNQPILFLPSKDIKPDETIIRPDEIVLQKLLEKPKSKHFIENDLKIKEPSAKDYIINYILQRYKNELYIGDYNKDANYAEDFMTIYNYYCHCSSKDADEFLSVINKYNFIMCFMQNNPNDYTYININPKNEYFNSNYLYMPSKELTKYFAFKPDTKFIPLDEYQKIVSKNGGDIKKLKKFFNRLGVNDNPSIIGAPFDKRDGDYHIWGINYILDGLSEIITNIANTNDKKLSVFLWDLLCKCADNDILKEDFLEDEIHHKYNRRRKEEMNYEESEISKLLKSQAWLINRRDKFTDASKLKKNTLSKLYNTDKKGAKELLKILNITSEADKDKEMLELIRDNGLTLDDIKDYVKQIEKRKKREQDARSKELPPHAALSKHDINGSYNICSDDDDGYSSSNPSNPERYEDNIKKKVNNPNKEPLKVKTSIQSKQDNTKESEFLKSQYMGKCQICGEKIIDKNGKPVFVTHKLTKYLADEYKSENYLGWNSVCLCPNCDARLKNCDNNVSTSVDNAVKKSDFGNKRIIEIPINVSGKYKKIRYTAKHFIMFKAVLKAYDEKLCCDVKKKTK